MKKSLTRVLSLVLVLVMMLGVVPIASARGGVTGHVTTSGSTNVAVGTTVTINARVEITDNDAQYVDGSNTEFTLKVDGTAVQTKTGNKSASFQFTPSTADSYEITVSYRVPKWTDNSNGHNPNGEDNIDNCIETITINATDSYSIDITAPAKSPLNPGDTLTMAAVAKKNGVVDSAADIDWSVSGNDYVSIVGASGELTVGAGAQDNSTATITASYKVDGVEKASDTYVIRIKEKTHTIEVTPAAVTLAPDTTKQLSVVVKNPDGTPVSNPTVAWSVTGNDDVNVNENTGFVTVEDDAVKGTTATITATYTPQGKTPITDTCVVTVGQASYTVTISPENPSVVPGKTSDLTATVTDSEGTAVSGATVTWAVTGNSKISIGETTGVVTAAADASGEATVTATYVKDSVSYEGTATLKVADGVITCANYSAEDGVSNSHQLAPTCTGASTVYYKYEKVSGTATVSSTGLVTSTNPAFAEVKITAYSDSAKTEASKLAEKTVWVTFYEYNNISVEMPSGATQLDFDDKSDIKGGTQTLRALMLANTLGGTTTSTIERCYFEYSDKTQSIGKLTGFVPGSTYATVGALGDMTFQVTGGAGGKYTFVYTIVKNGLTDVVLLKGQVTINFDSSVANIEYSTTYDKAVTFKESDFYDFWKAAKMDSALDYVQFAVTTYVPKYGELYNSTSKTTAGYVVSAGQKYYYGTYTASSTAYDLGSVTYVPDKAITTSYDVEIPFTAVGTDTSEKVSGTVRIKLNEKGNVITSRGITFDTKYSGSDTYADQMKEAYKDATGKTLDYVIFELPAAEQASLYSKIPSTNRVAQASLLKKGVKLYTSKTTGELELDDVALVPAAGYAKKINLTYTGYDVNGETAKKLTITFEVKAKSASAVFSDVNAKNYSWASDSVDFLYYEGTAQGSNGKYNPSANITRRDFMLMLYRAFLAEDYGTFTVTSNFPDVVKGADSYSKEIYQAVGVAKYLGIAQGTNNKFNPTSNITRQEAMVLIYRTLETINKDLRTDSGVKLTSMKDASKISSWATTAISNLVGHGVIKGNNDNIKPLDPISRAEMAAILHRVITY